jgi:membrane-bound serine protease (ClpP class)
VTATEAGHRSWRLPRISPAFLRLIRLSRSPILHLAADPTTRHTQRVATIITLLLVGAVLIALETILPGLIAGTVGLGCLAVAIYLAYADHGVTTGNWVLGITTAGLVLGTLAWLRWFPDTRLARRFVSDGSVGPIGTDRPELLDRTGTALTTLRPSGTALIDNERVDVVTEGQMVEKGTPVKVVAIEGLRVVVRPQR